MPAPPTTPLRRVSHGSLYALARSQSLRRSTNAGEPYDDSGYDPTAPSDLAFLAPAVSELADEADALLVNARRAARAADALKQFNEGFAAYMYALEMNALTTYWPQAPNEASRVFAARREEERKRAEEAALAAANAPAQHNPADFTLSDNITIMRDQDDGDDGYAYSDAENTGAGGVATSRSGGGSSAVGKKGGKAKLTAKEKKERSMLIERAFGHLPLAFRGNDPSLHRNMETVLEQLIDEPTRGFRLQDLTGPPDLNDARARKCMLALTSAKLTRSDNSTGTVLYYWIGVPNR